jgi:hypothetical protein
MFRSGLAVIKEKVGRLFAPGTTVRPLTPVPTGSVLASA